MVRNCVNNVRAQSKPQMCFPVCTWIKSRQVDKVVKTYYNEAGFSTAHNYLHLWSRRNGKQCLGCE